MEPALAAAHPGPRKHVLAFAYSQTGQLASIVDAVLAPLRACDDIRVTLVPLRPLQPAPFPWSLRAFFDAFPESALMEPQPLAPMTLPDPATVDLVLLPYQVWFLSPSRPVSSLLREPAVRALLAGKPVVTLIGCRNMWLMAQEKTKALLAAAGARLLDNVVLTDRASVGASLVTTPMWMFTGRRDGWFGLPPAGVDAEDIRHCRRFGLALADALREGRERQDGPLLDGLGAVVAQPRLWLSERAGTRSFHLWGRLIRSVGRQGAPQRVPLLVLYVLVLLALILTVLPLSLALQALLRPWRAAHEARLKLRFEAPSGSGTQRMTRYDV